MFAQTYHQARSAFREELAAFARRSERKLQIEQQLIDRQLELTIDAAEYVPAQPERLFVCVSGTHGVEGYTGSAIQRTLLVSTLRRIDFRTSGLFLVHALNPWGFHHRCRVNASNVDLNRNFERETDPIYGSASPAYEKLLPLLQPTGACTARRIDDVRFAGRMLALAVRQGTHNLRRATLEGQYSQPRGVFYGGARPEVETRYFRRRYEALCARYAQILVVDLHTGYGERGRLYPLFAGGDTSDLRRLAERGVRDQRGRDHNYRARGDLVGYCREAAKRVRPDGTFDGLVLELGTHGLSKLEQLGDLRTVVLENQARQYGAVSAEIARHVKHRFSELFYPSSTAWQTQALEAAVPFIEQLLQQRSFLR